MIPLFKVFMAESVMEPLKKVLMSGYIGQGPKVDEFEAALCKWLECDRILTLNSCTSALQLALRLSNVEHGDEVLSTAMTCTATNVPILAMGAKPVWVDINPETGNMDYRDIEKKITPKTKALIMVHWGGNPCDIDEIHAIAKKHKIKVIEDGAHSFGSVYKGKKIGSHSDFVCFSFQAIKHLTTVDGGAVVCKSEADHKRGKLLRWYGINREGSRKDFRCEEDVLEYGYKFHMNDVCAVIGIEQMKYVDEIVGKHRANAAYYDQNLKGVKGVRPVTAQKDGRSAYWLYTLLVDEKQKFMEFMTKNEVQVSSVHARNDTHTMFKPFQSNLPNIEKFTDHMVCIPVGWWVTEKDRQHIVDTIKKFSK